MTQQLPEGVTAHYSYDTTVLTPHGRELSTPSLRTTCVLLDDDGRELASAESLLGPRDHFSAAVGNEVALGRALKKYAKALEEKIESAEAELQHEVS